MPKLSEVGIPEMESGKMEIIGYGDLIAAPMTSVEKDNGLIRLPFYCMQMHIFSFYSGVNLYGVYVIQDNALCVQVAAKSGAEEQKTVLWDLGRYANLTTGNAV
jgi:hypothetical protein